jgi:hypothetical protein
LKYDPTKLAHIGYDETIPGVISVPQLHDARP